MKSLHSTTSTRKKVIVAAIIIAVLAAAGAYWALALNNPPVEQSDDSAVEPAPSQLSEKDAAEKEEFVESSAKDNQPKELPKAETVKLSMAVSQEGNSVVAQTKVFNVTDGTCKLTATNGSLTTTKSADVMYQAEYSTCAGFSIPSSELGAGTWQLTLSVTSGGAKGSVTKSIQVK